MNRRVWLVVAVVVVALVASAIAVVATRSTAEAVQLEPVGSTGADPFAENMTVHEVAAFPDDVQRVIDSPIEVTSTASSPTPSASIAPSTAPPAPAAPMPTGGVVRSGTAPGLYGGTQDAHACDPAQLKSFLHDHADKASAWARAQGLSGPSDIDDFVDSLAPVVLTRDTWVTNHGFTNGTANPIPAVLQAGTAVMVDRSGVPRVKCACGNPLLPPPGSSSLEATTGDAWSSFSTASVVNVQAAPPVNSLQVVDVRTGQLFSQPVGVGMVLAVAEGVDGRAGEVLLNQNGIDERSWEKVMDLPTLGPDERSDNSGGAFGNGFFVVVTGTLVFASDGTGHGWRQVASVPDELNDVTFLDGRWIAVGKNHTPGNQLAGQHGVVYESRDASTWTRIATLPEDQSDLLSVAGGDGRLVARAYVRSELRSSKLDSFLYTSIDGRQWSSTQQLTTSQVGVAFGAGAGWLALGYEQPEGTQSLIGRAWRSADGNAWASSATTPERWSMTGPVRMGDGWFVAGPSSKEDGNAVLWSSADGVTWNQAGRIVSAGGSTQGGFELAFSGGSLPTPAGQPRTQGSTGAPGTTR